MTEEKYQILSSDLDPADIPGQTYVEVFEKNCQRLQKKVLYYFLEDGYNETSRITYEEMNIRAKAVAAYLQHSYQKGDRALLLFPPGIEFIATLFGCFYAGIIGVPAYPPRKNRMFDRFEAIFKDCEPSCILTTKKIHQDILKNFKDEDILKDVNYVDFEDIEDEWSGRWRDPGLIPEDLVLLQYTSGSTGNPNGVMVSHRQLIANSIFIQKAFGHTEELVAVHWLPGFHDMGLIGALIQPPFVGGCNAIIPPNSFLLTPMNWLRSISKFQCTTAGGPNFAIDFCVDRMKEEELHGLDLGTVRPFYCGSEPIRYETFRRFEDAYKSYNFRSDQYYPCYGMAESVLIISGGNVNDEPKYLTVDPKEIEKNRVVEMKANQAGSKMYVGCGFPWVGTSIVIVDPHTGRRALKSQVGEIWTAGPSVASGYWNKPGLTKETFEAYLADTGEGPFLRTGDLGFIHEGQLFITGRIKDLIIIRGLNHYPNDIERTVENAHDALQPATGAAFSVEAGQEERLVIAFEVRRTSMRGLDEEAVFKSIRKAIAEEHQVQVYAIALLRPGSMPKTSSGKVQRYKAKIEFLERKLNTVSSWKARILDQDTHGSHPSSLRSVTYDDKEVIQWIRDWMAEELEIPALSIAIDKPIASYGLDSLKAVLLASDASKEFGVDWPLDLFLEETSIEQIVKKGKELL